MEINMKKVFILALLVINTVVIAMDPVDFNGAMDQVDFNEFINGMEQFNPTHHLVTADDLEKQLFFYPVPQSPKESITASPGQPKKTNRGRDQKDSDYTKQNQLIQYLDRRLPTKQLVKIILKSCFGMDSAQATFMKQYFSDQYNIIENKYVKMMYTKFHQRFRLSNPNQQAIARWVTNFKKKLNVYGTERNFQNDLYKKCPTLDQAIKQSKKEITPKEESLWNKQLEAFGGSDALVEYFLKLQYSLTSEQIDDFF